MKSWEYFRSDNISLETSFSWLSDDIGSKSKWGLWRNVQKCQHHFRWIFPHTPVTPQHAVIINDVIIIGRRRIYYTSTLLRRCLCKRVDMYIITLSCTWRIYALSERLLVMHVACGRGLSALRYLMYFQFCGWRHVLLPWCHWARIKHITALCLEEVCHMAVPVGCQTTTVFGWVHQNAALGTESTIYDCFVPSGWNILDIS